MKELIIKLSELGYDGDESLSLIIDWIRVKYNFNIWIEHGTLSKRGVTHDLTTNFGCHRGGYQHYELAQTAGILKFFYYLENNYLKIKEEV